MVLIGYSGHALVAAGILQLMDRQVTAYCDEEHKPHNPLKLEYLGTEKDPQVASRIRTNDFFIAIGDNQIRKKVALNLSCVEKHPLTIIHPSAIISSTAEISRKGVMISAGVCVNPFSQIHDGAILNTSCVIEHECVVSSFAHIGPGTVLCGNVTVGECSFVGAGAVVRQNIRIGKNVMVGAGAVVVKDIPDGVCVMGNPSRNYDKHDKK